MIWIINNGGGRRWLHCLVLVVIFAQSTLAVVDQAEEKYKSCRSLSTPEEKRDCICNLSDMNRNKKVWKEECDLATQEVSSDYRKFDNIFTSAMAQLKAYEFDKARESFLRITYGPHHKDALYYLEKGIEDARRKHDIDVTSAQSQPAPKPKEDIWFTAGMQAFEKGDYSAAFHLFSQVPADSPNKARADEKAKLINEYQNRLKDGDDLASHGQYREAQNAYLTAEKLLPGRAADVAHAKANEINQKIAEADKPQLPPQPTPSPVMAETKRRIEDKAASPAVPAVTGDLDAVLRTGINSYYEGNLKAVEEAEFLLQSYLEAKGPKTGLASFYLGASNLAHMHLLDPKLQQKQADLRQQAMQRFRQAKQVRGFEAPERFISPKILEEYRRAG